MRNNCCCKHQSHIKKIENCKYGNIEEKFDEWRNAVKGYESDTYVENKYCKSIHAKIRYINPLIREKEKFVRINKVSEKAKQSIEKCLNFETKKYAYFDFTEL